MGIDLQKAQKQSRDESMQADYSTMELWRKKDYSTSAVYATDVR